MTDLYHQLGHRYQWSLASIVQDHVADGVIVAPRYMDQSTTVSLPREIRQTSIFDPQFFIPGIRRGTLSTYDFFPDVVAEGFTTSDYGDDLKLKSADLCVGFQLANEFQYCVIPTRYRSGSPSDFIESQMNYFVIPFLNAYGRLAEHQPILLQLILTNDMLADEEFRDDILNWLTGLREIAGIYLIPHLVKRRKQIEDIEFILSLLNFISVLRVNNLRVVLGYQNTEALVMLVADPTAIATGSYENLRMFQPNAFEAEDPARQRSGPNPRIYIPGLMQWIDSRYLVRIMHSVSSPQSFFETNSYQELMFAKTYRWHFSRPEPYKHYFVVFAKQFRAIACLQPKERFCAVLEACKSAYSEFQRLEDAGGIVFPPDSGKEHLPLWITALNTFGKSQGFLQ